MKALSVRQPWAWLIVHADEYPEPKRVENRDWLPPAKHLGTVLIHAGKQFDFQGFAWIQRERAELARLLEESEASRALGGVVGRVDVVKAIVDYNMPWASRRSRYHWLLANPKPLPFFPCKGSLGFFEIDYVEPQ